MVQEWKKNPDDVLWLFSFVSLKKIKKQCDRNYIKYSPLMTLILPLSEYSTVELLFKDHHQKK